MFDKLKDLLRNKVVGKVYELASATVRHGIGLLGMWLMANADATAAQVDSVEGGLMVLFSLGWSYARKLVDARRQGES